MGEIVTGHDARTEFPQIQWPTLCHKHRVMVHQSGVPERDKLPWIKTIVVRSFALVRPCAPFNQKATFSPPLAIVTTAVAPSAMSAATVTAGRHRATAATATTPVI